MRLKFHFLKNSSPELDIKIKAFTKVNVYEFLLNLTHTQTLHTPNITLRVGSKSIVSPVGKRKGKNKGVDFVIVKT